jgi:GNAT superfamily N-acetyltransferase
VSEAYRTGSGLLLLAPTALSFWRFAMSEVQVRPFRRADREQLTALVNAHIQAVVPGVSVSVNTVLSQLERDPGEFIVDPWVAERATLVAEQRHRVVAAAHLLRYGEGEDVGQAYRGTAEINWLLFWPQANHWPDSAEAASSLMDACLDRLRSWGVAHWHADGALPAPGVYGVPRQWPHVRALYEQAGFVHDGHVEIVLLARVDELPRPATPPLEGLRVERSVGESGTRLSGLVGDELIGFVEVETNLAEGGRLAHLGGWADVGNLHVVEAYRRRGVATWLVGQAADWLRLARADRLLEYAWPEERDLLGLVGRLGFRELTRTARGWHHRSAPGTSPEANATPGPHSAARP